MKIEYTDKPGTQNVCRVCLYWGNYHAVIWRFKSGQLGGDEPIHCEMKDFCIRLFLIAF